MKLPEPCLSDQCRSPKACSDWGYCRERNNADRTAPTRAQQESRRNLAYGRRIHAERLAREAGK